jgi:hypothetical protein
MAGSPDSQLHDLLIGQNFFGADVNPTSHFRSASSEGFHAFLHSIAFANAAIPITTTASLFCGLFSVL